MIEAELPPDRIVALRATYGPWAVVTGASDGIGSAFCEALAAAGFNLVLVARRREALAAIATALAERFAIQVRVIALDLGEPDQAQALAAATGGLDVGLFVAAAGFGTSGPFIASDIADEENMLDVNMRAVLTGTHHFATRFAARGKGGIVLLSSLVAFQGVPLQSHYAATKAWVQVLAEGLRAELKPLGVDVLSVAPGPVRTGFAARAGLVTGMADLPAIVAVNALKALGRATTVRPAFWARLLEAVLCLLPRSGRTAIMAQVSAGMTGQSKHGGSQEAR